VARGLTPASPGAPAAARALLAGIVDYAGLFPPAALAMEDAAAEYARWRRSPEAWMLGRFVLPAGRLTDFAYATAGLLPAGGVGEPWRLAALVSADARGDGARVVAFNDAHAGRAVVDAVEAKAATAAEARDVLGALPVGVGMAVEVPIDPDELEALLAVLAERGARAKVRTGGVVPEAIPSPTALARFMEACAAAGVGWKATAGLHHPLRADHPLTYAPDSPRAVTHGFLNVFAASALLAAGAPASELEPVLRETDAAAFRLDGEGLAWRQRRVPNAAIERARERAGASFGSCSFAEPVEGLRALGVLA
jgi:hypothetical protein